jgi:glycosyltransferase involved in cell wall biosynthesis
MSRKHFALVCQHFYPEMISTGMHMTELTTRLTELGWQITVYCAKPSWHMEQEEHETVPKELFYQGIRILRVPTVGKQQGSLLSRTVFALSFIISVGWSLWHKRADYPVLVITTNPPFLGLVSWLYSRLFKRPYLLIVYDVYPDIAVHLGVLSPQSWLTKAWNWMTRLILREATSVVVIGRDMADVIKHKIPRHLHERIVLIPNWSDEKHVRPVPRKENRFYQEHQLNGAFVVQYAGRMGRTHNLEPLVEAARLMADSNVIFQFIGEGAKRSKLEMLAASYRLRNIQFLPYQPMEHLCEMLSAADLAVVCLESCFTGLSVPSKAYGVIASGTPVLGFLDPESEIGQMITETGCGLVMRDPTAHQVATAIQNLMVNPEQRSAMADAGCREFQAKYTLMHAARAYDAALTAMLNGQ